MKRHLAEMTWPEVAAAVASGATTVILPLGATEQHGPHLPLGTDTMRAAALATRLAAHLPDVLVAPALPIGCSDEHAGFPGLLSLDAETLAAVIVDCARRLVGWGVRRLILLSAHGGNGRALTLAAQRLRLEVPELQVQIPGNSPAITKATLAVATADNIPIEVVGLHAGEGETSEMLHLRPDLVCLERVEPGYSRNMVEILPRLHERGLKPVTPNGILGNPCHAEADRGQRYLEAQVEALIRWLETEQG